MGEKDIIDKHLEDYNDVFADIVNVLIFNGQQIVNETALVSVPTNSMYKADDALLHEQERDVSKFWAEGKVQIALCGIENQMKEEADMPLRVMGYDGQSYRTQLLKESKKKSRSRYPVVTLVLYFGMKRWNAPKALHDCLTIPNGMKSFVSDYRINVFEIAYLTDEQLAMFTSDFRIVADYFVQMRRNRDYIPSTEQIKHVDAVLKMMSVLTGDDRFLLARGEKEGSVRTMCEAMDKAENRGLQRGLEQGLEQGERRLAELIHRLITDGRMEDVSKAATDELLRKTFYKEYGIID